MNSRKRKAPVIVGETKQCEECMEFKSFDKFYMYSSKTGLRPRNICRACHVARNQVKYREDPKKYCDIQMQRYHSQIATNPQMNAGRKLKAKLKRHGATMEWYEAQVKTQNGLCAICGLPEKSKGTRKYFEVGKSRLAIDHDAHTNKVRGLLCMVCNNRLSALEMKDWLPHAMAYLAKHQPI